MSGLDSEYVKLHLEDILTELIADLVQIQPDDPIEWLANALRQHARKQNAQVNRQSIHWQTIPMANLTSKTSFNLTTLTKSILGYGRNRSRSVKQFNSHIFPCLKLTSITLFL